MSSSAQATSTGTLLSAGARLLGVWVRSTATGGTVVLRDGGAGGTVLLTINTPAAVGGHFLPIAGGGIFFATDIHATLTDVDAITAIYH